MRRSLGGLVLIVGTVLLALAVGAWWLQRVAFTPSDDSGVALSILGDEDIRGQIATIVASADAPTLQQSPLQLKAFIEEIAVIPDGAALMSRIVAEGHARLLGNTDDLVLVTAEEQVTIVRDERVGEAAPLTLPVQRVGSMAFLSDWLGWFAAGAAALGLLIVLVGIVLRPERGEGTFALGVGLASLAGSLVLFGWIVPLAVLPAFSDDPWMGAIPRMADHHRNLTLVLAVIALVGAAVLVFATGSRRQRRQHSTPLHVGRYRDDRSWSR
jgi:hypothetical protein